LSRRMSGTCPGCAIKTGCCVTTREADDRDFPSSERPEPHSAGWTRSLAEFPQSRPGGLIRAESDRASRCRVVSASSRRFWRSRLRRGCARREA
jgi:hypothetical protein